MPEVEDISWIELTGNKFNKNLHPAMVSDSGYVFTQQIRRTGDTEKSVFQVHYDYDYVIGYLAKTICRTLSSLGKDKILELVEEAWDVYYKDTSVNATKRSSYR